jgi:hypothetical protein
VVGAGAGAPRGLPFSECSLDAERSRDRCEAKRSVTQRLRAPSRQASECLNRLSRSESNRDRLERRAAPGCPGQVAAPSPRSSWLDVERLDRPRRESKSEERLSHSRPPRVFRLLDDICRERWVAGISPLEGILHRTRAINRHTITNTRPADKQTMLDGSGTAIPIGENPARSPP